MDDTERRTVRTETNPGERGKWISGLVALLGLWLVVAAFVFELVETNFWNYLVVGLLLVVLGRYDYARRSGERRGSVAAAAFAALLGLWSIVSPGLVDTTIGGMEVVTAFGFWNSIVVGALALVLGADSAYEARGTGVRATPQAR